MEPHENEGRGLRAPIVRVDTRATLDELHREEPWRVRGHNARTLVKHPDLRVVLVAMREGSRLHEHQTAARITIQVIVGRIRLHVGGEEVEMRSGELLSLDRDLAHDVEAFEESAFLLTLSAPHAP